MLRENVPELMEAENVPDDVVELACRDLARIHRCLGDTRSIVRAIRRERAPVRRILDIGCGNGAVLREVQRRLGVEAVGVDKRPLRAAGPFSIVKADAVHDPLPEADIAYSMHTGHHLTETEFTLLIRNVGRYCRRFVILDLVRHPAPLMLFRAFVAPLVSRLNAADGNISIRRSFTPEEFRAMGDRAVSGTGASLRHSVAPFFLRQVLDIEYGGTGSGR
jgi:SAM-dependent methyltransferase